MKIGVRLNLQTFRTATITEDFSISFADISNLQEWDDSITVSADVVNELEMYYHDGERYLGVDTTNPVQQPEDEFYDDDVSRPSLEGYIIFNCNISDSDLSTLLTLINLGIVELDQFGKTNMIVYRLNDERDNLSKNLIPVTILEGKFTAPLGIKALELDVVNYNIDNSYNYVYIPKLKRYYYITNIQLTTKDYTKLLLQEDVLMSWASLIKQQGALITRYEYATNKRLVDVRRPVEDVIRVTYPQIRNTDVTLSNKNTTLNADIDTYNYNFLITYMGLAGESNPSHISAPHGTSLNGITALSSPYDSVEVLKYEDMGYFMLACHYDSGSASFIKSVVCLPFNPEGVLYPLNQSTSQALILRNGKSLRTDFRFEDASDTTHAHVFSHESRYRACPYFVTADFTIEDEYASGNYLDYEPNSNYEIYIAFVGWVNINANQIIGKRLMIYYTLDFTTGSGTAYLYNVTDDLLVWSSNCQIGVKLDFETSNALEISKQKSANELNTILNSIGGIVSMIGGGVSGNALGVVGGAVALSKTVASSINLNNSLFQSAQISFGTSEGVIHTSFVNNGVIVRKSYHRPISINENTFKKLEGYPYNVYESSLSSLTGYVEVGDIHFNANGYNIYQTEIDEIVALLKNGVIL